jgi:LacI family transcriptional regulator
MGDIWFDTYIATIDTSVVHNLFAIYYFAFVNNHPIQRTLSIMLKNSTINDIAKQLGVSNALVSFVLNGKSKEMRISDKMTSKVLELAKELNYTPNYLAKSLRSGRTFTLGIIVGDISNPFFAKLARHIEVEALKSGYKVVFGNSDENLSKFSEQLQVLKSRQVDGLILTPPAGSEGELYKLKEQKIPFVVLDRKFNKVDTHSVVINNYQASYDATERLIKNNRKNIALINIIPELFNMKQREEGFIDALKNNGVAVNKSLIKHLEFTHEKKNVMEAIQDIVQNNADAVLFATSKMGILGIECIRELGVNLPDDMSVISFDDTSAYRVSYTPITAVVQPLEQMSKEAVRILINIIEDKYNDGQYENIEFDVELVYRKSCC